MVDALSEITYSYVTEKNTIEYDKHSGLPLLMFEQSDSFQRAVLPVHVSIAINPGTIYPQE